MVLQGIFELISLCGSFAPDENGLADCRTGGLSVSLAGADGQLVGGGLAGLLVAAGPVQVIFCCRRRYLIELEYLKKTHEITSFSLCFQSVSCQVAFL